LQQSDPGLSPLFEQAEKGDERYFVRSGVLFRTSRTKLALPHRSIYQIVVPTTLRPQFLQIAHDGHFGVYKTRSSRLRRFFWPSIFRDIGTFCRSCDTCQCLGKGKKPVQAPLESSPFGSKPIPTDVLIQSQATEKLECPAPTSLPPSVPVIKTLLSKADRQLTSIQIEDLTALLDKFGDVFFDVPGRTTLGVHHTEFKLDTKPIRSPQVGSLSPCVT